MKLKKSTYLIIGLVAVILLLAFLAPVILLKPSEAGSYPLLHV